jgi:WD40 repeat protein
LWDAATGTELRSFVKPASAVHGVAFSPIGGQLLTALDNATAKLWNTRTGEELRTFTGHTDKLSSVSFSPDGTKMLTGSFDESVKMWDVATGGVLRTLSGHTEYMVSAVFSPDGTKVLSAAADKLAKMWDADTGAQLITYTGHERSLCAGLFSPDGTRVLTGSSDMTARLWAAATGVYQRALIGHTGAVRAVAFSPDGARVLTGSTDMTAKLWDANTGAQLRSFNWHAKDVVAVAFSPDGTKVLTGSWDKTAKLWDADTGAELRTFTGHMRELESVAFSPDGTKVLTGSYDETAKLWPVSGGSPDVLVPAVTGHAQAAAEAAIVGACFSVGAESQQCSMTIPAGAVISQNPAAGQQAPFGSAVTLVLSTGPCMVTVPNAVGQSRAAADIALGGANLVTGTVTEQCSGTVAEGIVMNQNPAAGQQANLGSTVALVVSSGPCKVTVPGVVGQTQGGAGTALTRANLSTGTVTQQCSAGVEAGRVISQDPAAGARMLLGSAVALVVSTGACSVEGEGEGEGEPAIDLTVPQVVGLAVEQAQTTVTGAGLTISVAEESSDTVAAGLVLRQQPAAGMQVAPGTQVSLVVSSGPEDTGCAGCSGCSGGKGTFTLDKAKKAFGDLFLAGLSLVVLSLLSRHRTR